MSAYNLGLHENFSRSIEETKDKYFRLKNNEIKKKKNDKEKMNF
jgi:hypothetical protein